MNLTRHPTRAKRESAGFTLVELMVVVFITATMLAVAIPSFVRSHNASQLNAATRSLVTLTQLARLNAALTQKEVTLAINLDRQSLVVSGSSSGAAIKRISLPRQVRLQSAEIPDEPALTEGEVTIPFYPNGTCGGVTLRLQGSEVGEAVLVVIDSVTARAKLYEVKN